jgi:hypothetical protein
MTKSDLINQGVENLTLFQGNKVLIEHKIANLMKTTSTEKSLNLIPKVKIRNLRTIIN